MASEIVSIEILLEKAKIAFRETFFKNPQIAVCAPGRVNLIGEHTDYNEGFVFPMALPLVTLIVGNESHNQGKCCIKSLTMNSTKLESDIAEFNIPTDWHNLTPSEPSWANYIMGVIAYFHVRPVAFDAVVISSVPMGGGLSSSAALEVASYTFLEALTGSNAKSLKEKALMCQKAEHTFAGVPCGIMDQFISTMGKEGSGLLIDCRSLESTLVPLTDPDVSFVIINSNVKHNLSQSEYATRRSHCDAAAKLMNKVSLREASLSDIERFQDKIDATMTKRARHVITEIQRTQDAVSCLRESDYVKFGQLMNESHRSLRDDYEVSCPELDELVSIALSLPAVFGSRMTGAGFGGCTVTLVKKNSVHDLITKVNNEYSGRATLYVCSPSEGTKILFRNTELK